MSGKPMGFTYDPGPLPFETVRTQKWANRTWVGDYVEIHGEHGCTMPSIECVVTSIEPYPGPCPEHLRGVYGSEPLFLIGLRHVDDPPGRA